MRPLWPHKASVKQYGGTAKQGYDAKRAMALFFIDWESEKPLNEDENIVDLKADGRTGEIRFLRKLNKYEFAVEIRVMREGLNNNKWDYRNLRRGSSRAHRR